MSGGTQRPLSSVAPPERPDARIGFLGFLRLAGRALAVSFKARGAASCAVSAAGFLLALLPSLIAAALGAFTDQVQGLFEGSGSLEAALAGLAALLGLYLLQLLYGCVRSYYEQADTERIARYINQRTLELTCRVRMRFIDNSQGFAEKVAFADTAAGPQVAGSMQLVAQWLQNLVAFTALALVLAGVDPWMVLVVVATAAPGILIAYRQEREKYRLGVETARAQAFASMYYQDATRFQTLQETRFNRVFPYIKHRKWVPAVGEFVGADTAMKRRHVLQNAAADLLGGSVYLFILCLAAWQIFQDPALGLGAFTLALSAAGQMQQLAGQLFFGVTQFIASAPYMQDFFALDSFEQEEDAPLAAGERLQGADVVFEDVRFTYPDAPSEALKGVSVRIRAGEHVAVVGRNGSGKSTFVNLLCGLYAPDSGSVRVCGLDPYRHPGAVRPQLSAVFQDFARYEDTIRANITVSNPQRPADDAALMEIAEHVGAAEFICARSLGLDDVVGSYSEQGNNLSGGQWQRVAIARAAWRDQARIMLLDEPTSALDPAAEALIYRNFAELVGERSAILVSHRLGVASVVDRILVFEDGRIVEDGTLEELLAADGVFAELYHAQAQWYL
ncbi:MAG: ABC transporter ATP-binding protein [Coriobacteriales bacterium]